MFMTARLNAVPLRLNVTVFELPSWIYTVDDAVALVQAEIPLVFGVLPNEMQEPRVSHLLQIKARLLKVPDSQTLRAIAVVAGPLTPELPLGFGIAYANAVNSGLRDEYRTAVPAVLREALQRLFVVLQRIADARSAGQPLQPLALPINSDNATAELTALIHSLKESSGSGPPSILTAASLGVVPQHLRALHSSPHMLALFNGAERRVKWWFNSTRMVGGQPLMIAVELSWRQNVPVVAVNVSVHLPDDEIHLVQMLNMRVLASFRADVTQTAGRTRIMIRDVDDETEKREFVAVSALPDMRGAMSGIVNAALCAALTVLAEKIPAVGVESTATVVVVDILSCVRGRWVDLTRAPWAASTESMREYFRDDKAMLLLLQNYAGSQPLGERALRAIRSHWERKEMVTRFSQMGFSIMTAVTSPPMLLMDATLDGILARCDMSVWRA